MDSVSSDEEDEETLLFLLFALLFEMQTDELIEEQFRQLKSADDLEVWSENIFKAIENRSSSTQFSITTIGDFQ